MNLRRVYIYTFVCRGLCTCISTCASTRQRRCIGCLIFAAHFLEKNPIISGSFAERDLQDKAFYAFTPLCTCHVTNSRLKPSVFHGLLQSVYIYVYYIYMYIYIYVSIYISNYVHMYVCAYICMYMQLYMHSVYVYVHVFFFFVNTI